MALFKRMPCRGEKHKRICWETPFMRGRKGQVSTELIIVIAALLAVAVVLVVQLQKTSSEWSKKSTDIDKKLAASVDKTLDSTSTLKKAGASCTKDADCESGDCTYEEKCA
jgi:hypothetical protein